MSRTRHAKLIGMTAKEQLQLFVQRVGELTETRLGQEGFTWNLQFHFTRGQGLTVSLEQPDEDLLRSFLLAFRQFVSKGEPVHLFTIYNLCLKHITSDYLKEQLILSRTAWKNALRGTGIGLTIDGKEFTPEEATHIWLNGYYFHNDPECRAILARLQSIDTALVRTWFLHCVTSSADLVVYVGSVVKHALQEKLIAD